MMTLLVGILLVSLNTLPYQMLSQFHADKAVKNAIERFLFFQSNSFHSIQIGMDQNVASVLTVLC